MEKKIDWERIIWAVVGAIVAILLIAFELAWPVICVSLVIGFAILGSWLCKNKSKVKEKLKAFIDKI